MLAEVFVFNMIFAEYFSFGLKWWAVELAALTNALSSTTSQDTGCEARTGLLLPGTRIMDMHRFVRVIFLCLLHLL